jgi:hypothetical protein
MAAKAQHPPQVLNYWMQGTMRVIRRASETNMGVAFPSHMRVQRLDQCSFANAGFPAEEHHLPQPRLTLLPAPQEQPEFFLTPHQEGQPGRGRLRLVTRRLSRAKNTEDRHGLCHAFELVYPDILQGERTVEQARRYGT